GGGGGAAGGRKGGVGRWGCGVGRGTQNGGPPFPSVSVQAVRRAPCRWLILCGLPCNGTMMPSAKGAACGKRPKRAAIHAPCFSAKLRASFNVPRGGIVSTTSRLAA